MFDRRTGYDKHPLQEVPMQVRRHYREFGLSMCVYLVLLGVSIVLQAHARAVPVRVVLALLSMTGLVLVAGAILRELRRIDELQRRIQLEALAFSFCCTAIITFGWGFLETFVGLQRLPGFAIWGIMALLWVMGLLIAQRRYR